MSPKPGRDEAWVVLKRGMKKRCPHCGKGPLFRKWMVLRERCPDCGLVYERNRGDTWAFWVIGDRIPIAFAIILIYFGFRVATFWPAVIFFVALALPLVATMPNRQGIAVALDYLTRRYWPDSTDELPRIT